MKLDLKPALHCSHPIHKKKQPPELFIKVKSLYHRAWVQWHCHLVLYAMMLGLKGKHFTNQIAKATWHVERV